MPRTILPEPPPELKQLSLALCARIREELRADPPMPFSRFMEMALYEPGAGYYSAGLHKLGESGDFVTAPELGSLFAGCLSRQAAELGGVLGSYEILEIGAGTGRLAAELLDALPPNARPTRYRILERSADLKRVQRELLSAAVPSLLERVEWIEAPPTEGWRGLLIANEVLDALAVERFRIGDGEVEQLCVQEADDGFEWASRPAPEPLTRAVRRLQDALGRPFPEGYRSEVNLALPAWLKAVTESLEQGLALFIDYGYPRAEYYLRERSDGTLMCHFRHRAHGDPFFWPGLQDITAWVDFTALAEAAAESGLEVEGYANQAMFLLGCGLDQVLAGRAGDDSGTRLSLGAEARQLTLPEMMGERFQVMGLGRGLHDPLAGFSLQDLRYRL
ncbi:MAG: SAM-dependent methyltransferase [Lysobacterales bacterium]|jgi:SAM-dependent MidA family methyltransferase